MVEEIAKLIVQFLESVQEQMVEPALSAFIRSIVHNLSVVLDKGHSSPFQDEEPALRQLGQKLSQIQDLLIDAERRIKKEHSVSTWMDDLNELAYDMDEIIDETDIHIEHATRRRAADNTSQIAEGFVEAEKGQSLEDVVFQYYSESKGRSLVQENERMHGLIHSLACIISRKFFYRVKNRHSNSCKLLSSYRQVSLDGDYLFEALKLELRATAESLRTMSLLRCFAGGSSVELPLWKSLRVLNDFGLGLSKLPRFIGDMKYIRYLKIGEGRICHISRNQYAISSICKY